MQYLATCLLEGTVHVGGVVSSHLKEGNAVRLAMLIFTFSGYLLCWCSSSVWRRYIMFQAGDTVVVSLGEI